MGEEAELMRSGSYDEVPLEGGGAAVDALTKDAGGARRRLDLDPGPGLGPEPGPGVGPAPASPPSATFFDLPSAEEPGGQAGQAHDLEFAYDWGLGLAGRMSVTRALQLAKWAAARCHASDAATAVGLGAGAVAAARAPSEGGAQCSAGSALSSTASAITSSTADIDGEEGDERWAAPLSELQDALATLLKGPAVVEHRGREWPEPITDFTGPVADLERVLSTLSAQSQASHGLVTEATLREEEPDPADFAEPIAALREALAVLGGAAEPAQVPLASPAPEALPPRTPRETPLRLAGSVMAPLGSAQAVIRQKYYAGAMMEAAGL